VSKVRPHLPVAYSERADGYSPNAVAMWFHARYAELGIVGASSHSGRRSFITAAAKSTRRLAVIKPGEGWESRRGMRLKPAAVPLACAFGILK